jgi:hypothetical protein
VISTPSGDYGEIKDNSFMLTRKKVQPLRI